MRVKEHSPPAPNDVEAHGNMGTALEELGRLEEAEASFRQAIAIKPDYAEAHSNLGITLKSLDRLKEAEASFKQAGSRLNLTMLRRTVT